MNLSALRPWAGRATLLGGTLGFIVLVSPKVPREQELAFRLGQSSAEELMVSWTPDAEIEPQGGFSLNLGARGPATVRHIVSLPNGQYRFDIAVTRAYTAAAAAPLTSPQRTTHYVRRVTLDGDPTTIHLPQGQLSD